MARGPRKNQAFAEELGRRIKEASDLAGFTTYADMLRDTTIKDRNQAYVWARGGAVPQIEQLAEIARVCKVSLDWLVFGVETTPEAFDEWLASPVGKYAEEEARRFLRSLPTHGYTPSVRFYDLAYHAWKSGLTAATAVQLARDSERDDEVA